MEVIGVGYPGAIVKLTATLDLDDDEEFKIVKELIKMHPRYRKELGAL